MLYFEYYASFNILRLIGLKTLIRAPKFGILGFDPLNGEQSHRDPGQALPGAESRI